MEPKTKSTRLVSRVALPSHDCKAKAARQGRTSMLVKARSRSFGMPGKMYTLFTYTIGNLVCSPVDLSTKYCNFADCGT